MPKGLVALALGGFGIGLTEFIIMGLMPEVAGTFGVTEAQAGWLITGYALSVAVGALVVTAAVTRLPRKQVLLGLLVLFIMGNMLDAVAPTYNLMMLGRIIAALCHGAFFGIGSVVAGSMVAPEKKASAIAVMFTGLTVSSVLGVPLGTFLGQAFGWRSTFWAITVIGVVAFIGIALLVPATGRDDTAISLRRELRAFRSGQVWASLSITILGYGGMFGAFTYIAYLLTEVSGFPSSGVPWLLVVFGVGLFAGNLIGGRAADRALDRSLLIILSALTVVLVVFALLAENKAATIISLILMGGFGFATVPGLQMRVMKYAGEATTLVSGANIGAFNIGNALGAWIGGVTISAGLGYTSPIWAGAVITLAAVVVLTLSTTRAARPHRPVQLDLLDASRHVAPTR
ncbi:MFS transporter [Arthrobacter sp. Ld5]|uniref:MFS transporter n=1 Tax=Arthrobacter sp. Ld5 TaxID=649152 RepID=UPI003EBEB9FC